jgi:hypothetical protein
MSPKQRTVEVDASTADCMLFTQKEGLLSRVAHDLKIRVTSFSLAWDGASLETRFDPRSLRVVEAMANGRENPGALSDGDKKKIEKSIVADVLHAQIHFINILAAVDAYPVSGRCAFGWGNCDEVNPCPLHGSWSRLNEQLQAWAEGTILADVAQAPGSARERTADEPG